MYKNGWMVVKDHGFVDFDTLSDATDFRDKLDKQGITGVTVEETVIWDETPQIPTIPAPRTPVDKLDNCRRCGETRAIRDLLCHKCTTQVKVAS